MNDNEPAFPQTINTNFTTIDQNGYITLDKETVGGLTKREYFAAKAMQGLLANGEEFSSNVAGSAVWYADQLIKELEK